MRSQRLNKIALLMLLLFASQIASAETKYYRLTRTYNSKNQVIRTYNNSSTYVSPTILSPQAMPGTRGTCFLAHIVGQLGGGFQSNIGPMHHYNSSNNGWDIYVCTVGSTTDYVYIKRDGSCIRETMTARFLGFERGAYNEYLPSDSPFPDHLGPTR